MHFGAHEIELKHLDKWYFADADITKGDVIDYYHDVAEVMLTHLANRALTLQRFPDGIDEKGFFQQQCPDYFPDWITRAPLERAQGNGDNVLQHILCNDSASLLYLANQGTITLHGWLSQANRANYPDRLVLDLDPSDRSFDGVRFGARRVGELMRKIGLTPHVMTTGSRGLHVIAPLDAQTDFDNVRALAQAMAKQLSEAHPDLLTAEQRKDKRKGRLYLDVMRNAYGQTSVLPYSLRALPGAPVATPLDWNELDRSDLGPQRFTLHNLRRRLQQKDDPWRNIKQHAASAEKAHQRLEY